MVLAVTEVVSVSADDETGPDQVKHLQNIVMVTGSDQVENL